MTKRSIGTVRRRPIGFVAAAALAMAVGAAGSGPAAAARPNTVAGSATGAQATGLVVVGGNSATLGAAGGGPVTASAASASVFPLLSANLLYGSTQGDLGVPRVTSTATVANATVGLAVPLAALISLTAIQSNCTAGPAGANGGASVASLNGQSFLNARPNTAVTVAGLISVVVNEQTVSNTTGSASITVNAVHIQLSVLGVTQDVILGQSVCAVTGDAVNPPAIVPEAPLAALLPASAAVLIAGVAFAGYRRRRTHPTAV